jgi:hemin uptake protein HemP
MQNLNTSSRHGLHSRATYSADTPARFECAHLTASSEKPSQASLAVTSQQLLNGQKSVQILHQDQVYVLQATRQGKLILTK